MSLSNDKLLKRLRFVALGWALSCHCAVFVLDLILVVRAKAYGLAPNVSLGVAVSLIFVSSCTLFLMGGLTVFHLLWRASRSYIITTEPKAQTTNVPRIRSVSNGSMPNSSVIMSNIPVSPTSGETTTFVVAGDESTPTLAWTRPIDSSPTSPPQRRMGSSSDAPMPPASPKSSLKLQGAASPLSPMASTRATVPSPAPTRARSTADALRNAMRFLLAVLTIGIILYSASMFVSSMNSAARIRRGTYGRIPQPDEYRLSEHILQYIQHAALLALIWLAWPRSASGSAAGNSTAASSGGSQA